MDVQRLPMIASSTSQRSSNDSTCCMKSMPPSIATSRKARPAPRLLLELVVQAPSPSARVGAPIADEDPSALASARRPSCPRGGVGRHRDRIAGFHRNGIGADGRSPVRRHGRMARERVTARADACSATRRAPWSRSQRRCAPTPAGSLTRTFGGWSDFRCPAAPTCTLTIDGDGQSLVALFDPQIVGARFAGSTLDSADRERAAVSAAMRDRRSAGRASGVSGRAPPLHARRPEAAAGGEWNPGLCDIPVSTSRCEVVAGHLRWTSLRFGTADFPQDIPPAVVVRFGVRKSGGKGVPGARRSPRRRVIANRLWRMRAGTRTLRVRVPARAARGTYRLWVTVRSSSGEAQQFARTLTLPG